MHSDLYDDNYDNYDGGDDDYEADGPLWWWFCGQTFAVGVVPRVGVDLSKGNDDDNDDYIPLLVPSSLCMQPQSYRGGI